MILGFNIREKFRYPIFWPYFIKIFKKKFNRFRNRKTYIIFYVGGFLFNIKLWNPLVCHILVGFKKKEI